jgi:hypothetical protein
LQEEEEVEPRLQLESNKSCHLYPLLLLLLRCPVLSLTMKLDGMELARTVTNNKEEELLRSGTMRGCLDMEKETKKRIVRTPKPRGF